MEPLFEQTAGMEPLFEQAAGVSKPFQFFGVRLGVRFGRKHPSERISQPSERRGVFPAEPHTEQ